MAAKKHHTEVNASSKKSQEIRPKKPINIPNKRKIRTLEIHNDPTITSKYAGTTKSLKGKLNE